MLLTSSIAMLSFCIVIIGLWNYYCIQMPVCWKCLKVYVISLKFQRWHLSYICYKSNGQKQCQYDIWCYVKAIICDGICNRPYMAPAASDSPWPLKRAMGIRLWYLTMIGSKPGIILSRCYMASLGHHELRTMYNLMHNWRNLFYKFMYTFAFQIPVFLKLIEAGINEKWDS